MGGRIKQIASSLAPATPTVASVLSSANTDHARVLLAIEQDDIRIAQTSMPGKRGILARAWAKNHGLVGRGPLANRLSKLGRDVLAAMRECPTWSVRLDSILMEAYSERSAPR